MLKFQKLPGELKMFKRPSQHPEIPLLSRECNLTGSLVNRLINMFLFVQQKSTKMKTSKERRMPLVQYLRNYRKEKPLPENNQQLFISNEKYKRISPEFLNVLQECDNKRRMYERKPVSLKNAKPVPPKDPSAIDNLDPKWAAYLRNIMENGSIMNDIYGIDFYNNLDPPNMYRDPCEDINSFQVVHLLKILSAGGTLTPNQVKLLQNMLNCLAAFDYDSLRNFLRFLDAENALPATIIDYLQKLLLKLARILTPSQLKKIWQALEKFKEPKRTGSMGNESGEHKSSVGKEKDHIRRRTTDTDATKLVERRNLKSLINQNTEKPPGQKIQPRIKEKNITFEINRFDEDGNGISNEFIIKQFESSKHIDATGKRHELYYEPWDVDSFYNDVQPFSRLSLIARKKRESYWSHIDLNTFQYRDGFEKYETERKRTSEIEAKVKKSKNKASRSPSKTKSTDTLKQRKDQRGGLQL